MAAHDDLPKANAMSMTIQKRSNSTSVSRWMIGKADRFASYVQLIGYTGSRQSALLEDPKTVRQKQEEGARQSPQTPRRSDAVDVGVLGEGISFGWCSGIRMARILGRHPLGSQAIVPAIVPHRTVHRDQRFGSSHMSGQAGGCQGEAVDHLRRSILA